MAPVDSTAVVRAADSTGVAVAEVSTAVAAGTGKNKFVIALSVRLKRIRT
jgi:hypothetical protein